MVAHGSAHARQLLARSDRAGSAVVVSGVSVYADEQGEAYPRTAEVYGDRFVHAAEAAWPAGRPA
ncbi:hypothetical protein ACKI1J_22390 [Streptomyces scabiei]|uniref:hypothetical protein n=1 Tax=Streptomyces scabiei TaxID=1930 RepID=UPI0038F6C7A5